MNRIFSALILTAIPFFSYCQICNEKEAVARFQSAQEQNDNAEAARLFELAADGFKCSKQYDNYLIATYYSGAAYLLADNPQKAKELLERGLQDTHGLVDSVSEVNALIYHSLGEAFYGLNDAKRSVYYYTKSIGIIGEDDSEELAVCLFNLGNSYELLAQYNRAISCHLKSIEMKTRLAAADSNDYYQAYSTLGDIYQTIENADSANYYYRQAGAFADISNSESVAYLKFKEAHKLYSEQKHSAAKVQFDEVKSLCDIAGLRNDVYANSCFYLGLLNEELGNLSKAKSLLQQALECQKTKDDTYYNILIALGRVKNLDNEKDAATLLNNVVAESGNAELKNLARIELAKIYEKSNTDSAKSVYNQIVANIDSVAYPIIYAQAICGIANVSSIEGNSAAAIALLQRAQKMVEGKNAEFEANIYTQIGDEFFKQDNTDSAQINYESAYGILSVCFGKDNVKTLSAEESLAVVYIAIEKFKKAVGIYERSLAVKSGIYGEYDAHLFDLYSNYANAQYNMHKYVEAGNLYDKCLQIIERENIAESKLDIFYNNYGLYNKAVGDYKQALLYTQKSLDIKRKLYGDKSIKFANTLNNLGTIYDRIGNFGKSAECFEQAETIIVTSYGETSSAISEVYINRGNLYNRLGQNELALVYYNKVLDIKKEQGTAADRKLAPIYNNVGTVHQNLEDYRLAQFFFKKSLDLTRKYEGENSPETAESYNNLGNVMLKIGKNRAAVDNYLKAGEIYARIPSVNPVLAGNTNNNIATAYLQLNQLDTALQYYYRSVELYKNVFGEKHPYLALIYNNIGNINVKLDNYAKAIETYNLAIESNHSDYDSKSKAFPEPSGYYDQNVFVNSLLLRASAVALNSLQTLDTADLAYAFRHYTLCDIIVTNMRRSALTKNDKLDVGKIASACCEGALEVCMQMLALDLPENQRKYYQEQAFLFAEKGKSNSLLESMVGQDAMQLANIPEDLQRLENQLSADVLYYEKLLADKPKNAMQVRDSLLVANRRHNDFVKKLEDKFPEYHQLKYADNTISLNELQQSMKKGTMLIMYVLGDDALYSLNISGDVFSISVKKVSKNIGDTVRFYRNSIIQTSSSAIRQYVRLSQMFYKLLIPDSIDTNIRQLVIIPDGALNQIPYESLISEDVVGSIYDYSAYNFLIRRYPVSYAYSATLYYRDIIRDKQTAAKGWLGFAPVFTTGKYSGVLLDSRIKKNERNYSDIQVFNNPKLEPLASSETEVRNIFSMFNKAGMTAKACLWGCANRSNFSTDSVSGYRYIHLATHGFVNSEKPELSGVQLSCLKGDKQDGILYSSDVYGLKLNCDLLILSACETGLGKIMKGEGIVGLSRAFLYAGSKNLLVSLWKVADSSTSLMMMNFYKQLLASENAGLTYAELLQKAKLALMSDKNYARPYYWSPFILIGD